MFKRPIIIIPIAMILLATASFFLLRYAYHPQPDTAITTTPGVNKHTIRIGSVKALTGPTAFLGAEYSIGEQTYINALNDAGGIHGRKIQLVTYDDQYDPPKTVYFTQKLIVKDDIFALLNYVGTPTGRKVVPMLNETNIPLIGLFSGAQIFRTPLQQNIFNIRVSYHEEAATIVDYLVKTRGITKIGILYQYDDFGFDVLQGIEQSMKAYGLQPTMTAPYQRNTLDIEPALNSLQATRPEVIILAAVYGPSIKFVTEAHAKNFNPLVATMSFVGPEAFAQALGKDGEGIIVSQTMPLPNPQPVQNCENGYEQLLARYFPGETPSFGTLEGFVNAKILTEGMRRAGPGLTRKSLMSALETLSDYPIGDKNLRATFTATDHQALQSVYLTKISAGTFVPVDPNADLHDCIRL